jgi:hypothetical protein
MGRIGEASFLASFPGLLVWAFPMPVVFLASVAQLWWWESRIPEGSVPGNVILGVFPVFESLHSMGRALFFNFSSFA